MKTKTHTFEIELVWTRKNKLIFNVDFGNDKLKSSHFTVKYQNMNNLTMLYFSQDIELHRAR